MLVLVFMEGLDQVIVIGGALAGLSAAHTVLENGGRVLVLEKMAFCGGNSTKATSGINGAATRTQRAKNIPDSPELFEQDTLRGGAKNKDLVKVLTHESGPCVEWLMDSFGLDLSLVSRLGGHSQPRTHRGPTKFPGMTITYALMEKYDEMCEKYPNRARLFTKADAKRFILSPTREVIGVEFLKDGKLHQERGSVIVATGGFGYDYEGLLKQYRPDLLRLPTTNGEHTTGDGIKMAMAIGCETVDLDWIQVHPTGLVNPAEPDSKWKFLAAEALRGVGGVILDKHGNRIANELGRRDYVTGQMWKNQGPFRLILNSKASKEIEWHCKHYKGRGLMKYVKDGKALADELGVSPSVLSKTFSEYNTAANKQESNPDGGPYEAYPSGKSWDVFGKKFFTNMPLDMADGFHVAIITPVIHYCMGGLKVDSHARVIGNGVSFLYGAGEVNGGIHGENRLGGSSLLDCVVFGRVAGRTATREMLQRNINVLSKQRARL